MALKTDYKDDVFNGNRKYKIVNNSDGTISLQDVTEYVVKGDCFGSAEINTINKLLGKRQVIYGANVTIKEGSVAGQRLIYNEVTGEYEPNPQGIGIYDGTDIILSGVCFLDDLKIGYNHYAQADATNGIAQTPFLNGCAMQKKLGEQVVAFLMVNIQGAYGKIYAYNKEMKECLAVIGRSQTVRVKSEMPDGADGYYLCYKPTAWAEGDDENTGTLVGNFTQNYVGDNIYYTIEGLQNNTWYHLKWFPHKGGIVNRNIGVNEKRIQVQKGLAYWNLDDIIGTTVKDSFNSYDLTKSGSGAYVPFKIGNGIQCGWSYAFTRNVITPSTFSLLFWWRTDALGNVFAREFSGHGGIQRGWEISHRADGNVDFRVGDGVSAASTTKTITGCGLSLNTDTLLCFVVNRSTRYLKVYKNAVLVGQGKASEPISMSAVTTLELGRGSNSMFDQVMLVEGEISVDNQEKILNGGVGC